MVSVYLIFHHSRKSTRLAAGDPNSNFRSLATCLISLDKSVNLSEPQFPHLQNSDHGADLGEMVATEH